MESIAGFGWKLLEKIRGAFQLLSAAESALNVACKDLSFVKCIHHCGGMPVDLDRDFIRELTCPMRAAK